MAKAIMPLCIRDLEVLKDGAIIRFVEIDPMTGTGIREITDESGNFVIDHANHCFKTEPFEFDTIRLRRDASDFARKEFAELAKSARGRTHINFVA